MHRHRYPPDAAPGGKGAPRVGAQVRRQRVSIQADGIRAVQHALARIRESWKDCPVPILAMVFSEGLNYGVVDPNVVADLKWLPESCGYAAGDEFWTAFSVDPSTPEPTRIRLKAALDYATHYRRDVETLLEIIDGLCSGEIDGKQLAALREAALPESGRNG